MWVSPPGGGGGGKRSEAVGGGGKKAHSGGGEGKSPPHCFAWLTLVWRAKGRLARLSFPGLGGAGGPAKGSLEGDPLEEEEGQGEDGGVLIWGANLLSRFFLDSW